MMDVIQLLAAIRAHRDTRGDDRCWRDDETLYSVLPEGYTPPVRDTLVELDQCHKFIASRQHPTTVYVSPQRRIEELENLLRQSKREHGRDENDDPCEKMNYLDGLHACTCGADEWNVRVDATVDGTVPLKVEQCICAAIRLKDGRIIRGHRHDFCFKYAQQIPSFKDSDFDEHQQGFITSDNRFVDRFEGMRLQIAAGIPTADPDGGGGYRVGNALFSEDLY